jgi:hypothetical protein
MCHYCCSYMIHRGTPSRSNNNGTTNTIAAADVRSGSKNSRNNNNNSPVAKGCVPIPPSLVSGAHKGGSAKTANNSNIITTTPAVTRPVAALECLNSLQFFCVKVCVTPLAAFIYHSITFTALFLMRCGDDSMHNVHILLTTH